MDIATVEVEATRTWLPHTHTHTHTATQPFIWQHGIKSIAHRSQVDRTTVFYVYPGGIEIIYVL